MQSGFHTCAYPKSIHVFIFALAGLMLEVPAQALQFSHDKLDRALAAHVRDGAVDYPGLNSDENFVTYLQEIAGFDPDLLDG
jgi:hypothetical protein